MPSGSSALAALVALGAWHLAPGLTTAPASHSACRQAPALAESQEPRAESRLSYWPSTPRQGQTLFLRWSPRAPLAADRTSASATWDGAPVPLVARNGALVGVVGL